VQSENRVAADFRWQAQECRVLGSPLYGMLLDRCADDIDAGGPTAELLEGHLGLRRRDVLPLRFLAGVHAVVLTGQAPQLAEFYPSAGGEVPGDEESIWERFRAVLIEHREAIEPWLDHAPQTNEVGRGAVLAGGLSFIGAESPLPVRLVEIGASAGLNLRADHFRIAGDVAQRGPENSPLVLPGAWRGVAPPQVAVGVVDRVGIDLAPVDPLTRDGQLRLKAFVWPDQVGRHARLDAAFQIASQVPARLVAGDAIAAVQELRLVPDTWTVLWHSVFRQYLDTARYDDLDAAIRALGEQATPTMRLAHLTLEPERGSAADAFPVVLTTWPGARRRSLATAPAHGVPVTWLESSDL
jgi:hypothetical protein